MRPLLLLASAATLFAAEPVTFLRDVAPILNKASCTSGPCHGAAKGKNGFKLSLRAMIPSSTTKLCCTIFPVADSIAPILRAA